MGICLSLGAILLPDMPWNLEGLGRAAAAAAAGHVVMVGAVSKMAVSGERASCEFIFLPPFSSFISLPAIFFASLPTGTSHFPFKISYNHLFFWKIMDGEDFGDTSVVELC